MNSTQPPTQPASIVQQPFSAISETASSGSNEPAANLAASLPQTTVKGMPKGTVAIVYSWQRHVTICIIFASIALLIGWDVYASWGGVHSDTISEVSLSAFWLHPAWPASIGYLMGHLTWPNNNNRTTKKTRAIILIIIGLIVFALDYVFHVLKPMPPIIPFAICIPIGHILWPQVLQE